MKYYSPAVNPFSKTSINKVLKIANADILKKSGQAELQLIALEDIDPDIKNSLNNDLKQYDLELEHFLIFFRLPGRPIVTHIDTISGEICNASFVFPLALKDHYTVYWQDGNYELIKITDTDQTKVDYYVLDWKEPPVTCLEEHISDPIIVKTDVPHGVYANDNKMLLVTARFIGNPSFDELCQKLSKK